MKTIPRLQLILALVLPAVAQAETIAVRSGDHNGFTRIVVPFDGSQDWQFGRVAGGFELRPGRDDIAYRLDRVFDKIGRSRIADVRDLGDGRLHLAVDCACHAVVDELQGGAVVLDIVAGQAREPGTGANADLPPFVDAPEDPGADAFVDPEESEAPDRPLRPPVAVSDRAGLPLTLPRFGRPVAGADRIPRATGVRPATEQALDAPPLVPDPRGAETAAPLPETAPLPEPGNAARAEGIAKTETALLEQVARAAAQGLLDADLSEIEENVATAQPGSAVEPSPPEFERPLPPVAPRGHISVETGVDRAASGGEPLFDETAEGDACIDSTYFDVATWGGDVENGTDIGAYRSRIVGEFDLADGAGVTALARNYVYITFGAEAKALMRRYPTAVERPDLLFAMAEVMDTGQSSAAAELVDQMTCDGATALWATLVQPDLRPGQAINRDAVALAFGSLPAHLRRHLGPGLADNLLDSGDRETADIIRAAIDRASSAPTSEFGLLSAKFDLDSGDVEQATARLDDVVATGDAAMPEALLQRVEATLASGGAVPEDIIVLLDGLGFQFRGSETARQMTDAGIRARASAADFTGAFGQLDAAASAGVFAPGRLVQLRQEVFDRLTLDADDTDFLRHAVPRLDAVAGLPRPARRMLAARLLDLGLAGAARDALGDDTAMPEPTDRLLLARAALAEGRPAVAIGYLAGLTDAPALTLRATALDMARDHEGAVRAYGEAGDRAEMLRTAWRGGLWPEVARLDQGPMGRAARLMTDAAPPALDETPAPGAEAVAPGAAEAAGLARPLAGEVGVAADDQKPLAAAQALIVESKATREALAALLVEVPPPAVSVMPAASPEH